MKQLFRLYPEVRSGIAATLLALCLSLPATNVGAAEVFISRYDIGLLLSDPAFVASSGLGHNAEVDLQNGTVKALVSESVPAGISLLGHSLTAGIDDVYLVNAGATPIVASSGFLTLALDGAFSFVTAGTGEGNVYVNAFIEAMLTPALGGETREYFAGIGASHGWNDWQGFHSDFTEISEDDNGSTVAVSQNDTSGLQADLAIAAITLNPGDTLRISLSLFTGVNAANGVVATNDFFNTARLSLDLPPGAIVTSDAGVPLDWISAAVPAPPTAWLLATGVAGILGACRRRRG